MASETELGAFIESYIREYLEAPEHNNLGPGTKGKAWVDVLLGFSHGADPLFGELKEHAGPQHWTPAEAFALAEISDDPVAADELTVVSWALCQSDEAKRSNRREQRYPSETWARARMFGQQCNDSLHHALVAALLEAGYLAVAPAFLHEWSEHESERFYVISSWSERHIAYVSGLGTFSLAGGLITERGQAVRFGSVVVKGRVPATPRSYSGPFDYCLYFSRGICARCVQRCPVGSVRKEGRDKEPCSIHLGPAMREYVESHFDFKGYACGLCQTGVPCESRIPGPKDVTD